MLRPVRGGFKGPADCKPEALSSTAFRPTRTPWPLPDVFPTGVFNPFLLQWTWMASKYFRKMFVDFYVHQNPTLTTEIADGGVTDLSEVLPSGAAQHSD